MKTADDLLASLFVSGGGVEEKKAIEEESLSESSEGNGNSDDDDIFDMRSASSGQCCAAYEGMFLRRWQLACQELCVHLRESVLLPLDPQQPNQEKVWTDVQSGVVLPPWHCAFAGCDACEKSNASRQYHEHNVWQHVWNSKAHQATLLPIIYRFALRRPGQQLEDVAFTLYSMALAEKERSCCPLVGLATDRRTLCHIGEVFREDSVEVLLCFICGCKHLSHEGVDKFGRPQQKGTISYRRYKLQELLESVDSEHGKFNHSLKFFKDRFGGAVAMAPELQQGCTEWVRRVRMAGGDCEILCCPEDVSLSRHCRHNQDHVCSRCNVPICNECWRLSRQSRKIPKALTNDNVIGYVHKFLVSSLSIFILVDCTANWL